MLGCTHRLLGACQAVGSVLLPLAFLALGERDGRALGELLLGVRPCLSPSA